MAGTGTPEAAAAAAVLADESTMDFVPRGRRGGAGASRDQVWLHD